MKKLLLLLLLPFVSTTTFAAASIVLTTPSPLYGCPHTTQNITIGATNKSGISIPGSVIITVVININDATNTTTLGTVTQTLNGFANNATKYFTISVAFQGPMTCNVSGTASFTYGVPMNYPFSATYVAQYPQDLTITESPANTIAVSSIPTGDSVYYYLNGNYATRNHASIATSYTPSVYGSYTAKAFDTTSRCLSANPSNAIAITQFKDQTASIAPGLTRLAVGGTDWADIDNDNDLDFIITGYDQESNEFSQIWQNGTNGSAGTFTDVTYSLAFGLPAIVNSSGKWGDYDGDGDQDLLLTGTQISQIWRNGTSGTTGNFTNQTSAIASGLTGVDLGTANWVDYDNDGDLDIFIMGGNSSSGTFCQFMCNGTTGTSGNFTDQTSAIAPGIVGFFESASAWGDYDNDGDLDLIINGQNGTVNTTQIWRNGTKGAPGTFTDQTSTIAPGLPATRRGSLNWGDYDNDGDLDILLSGDPLTTSQIWRNGTTGASGTFTDQTSTIALNLTGGDYSSSMWGDYDNDGDLDILVSGANSGFYSEIWCNGTAGTSGNYTKQTTAIANGLSGIYYGRLTWVDYDKDHDLDFVVTGIDNALNNVSQIWQNSISTANIPPTAPTGLTTSIDTNSGDMIIKWSASTDNTTSQKALSYNVRVGTAPGLNDIAPCQSSTTGFNKIIAMGNGQLDTSFTLTGLTPGNTYYWSVQAIDNCYEGGSFATENSFVAKTTQHITFPSLSSVTVGDADYAPGATSTNNSVAITYTSSNSAVATIVSGNIHIVGTGSTTITAHQAGDATHFAATDVPQSLTVNAISTAVENALAATVNVYPNPASEILYVELGNTSVSQAEMTLRDMSGMEIGKVSFKQQGNSLNAEFPISQLAEGIYVLHIQTNQGVANKRIVKK